MKEYALKSFIKNLLMTSFVFFMLLLGSFTKVYAENLPSALNLVDFDKAVIPNVDHGSNCEISTEHVLDGNVCSLHWNKHTEGRDVLFVDNSMITNWSGYDSIELQIYSEKATNGVFKPTAWGDNNTRFAWDNIAVDWEGWKTIKLSFADATMPNGELTWSKINSLRLYANGNWETVADAETDLYVGEIKLLKENVSPEFSLMDSSAVAGITIPNLDHGSNCEISTEYIVDGNKYSLHWNKHAEGKNVVSLYHQTCTDWSGYDSIELQIYSAKATNGVFKPTAWDNNNKRFVWDNIAVDWEGWKTITLSFADATMPNGELSWSNIGSLRLYANGNWETVADAETDLYIGNIKLLEKNISPEFGFMSSTAEDTNIPNLDYGSNCAISTENVVDGNKYSLHWTNHTEGKNIASLYHQTCTDWSGYDSIELQIYSAKATNGVFKPTAWDNNNKRFVWDNIAVDWEGWKTITLSFADATMPNGELSWSNIGSLRLYANGSWGTVADAETDLYIGNIKLLKKDITPEFSLMDSSAAAEITIPNLDHGSNCAISTEHVVDGNKYSLQWTNHTEGKNIASLYHQTCTDWSGYDSIELQIYSAKATNGVFKPTAWDNNNKRFVWDNIAVDWEGWKTITLSFADATMPNGELSWLRIESLRLFANGSWGTVADAETDLYIGNIKLLNQTGSSELKLADFSKVVIPDVSVDGGILSAAHAADNNKFSIRWNDHTDTGAILFVENSTITDWSEYDSVKLKIYSEKATDEIIKPTIFSPSGSIYGGNNYFYWNNIVVDWTGWKTFELYFNEAIPSTERADLSNIMELRLYAHGAWGMQGNPETDLYIGEIKLEVADYSYDFLTSFYDTEDLVEANEKLQGSVAVYAGGSNIVKAVTLDSATGLISADSVDIVSYCFGWEDSKVTIPVSLFNNYFGADVTETDTNYQIVRDGVTVSGTVGEKKVTVNGNEVDLEMAAKKVNGEIFISGAEFAELLGLYYECDNKLLVIGTTDKVDAFGRVENLGVNELGEIVAYLAYHDDLSTNELTAEDCASVKENWVRSLVGDVSTNDVSDPDIKARVDGINAAAQSSWNMIIKDQNATEIFQGLNSVASNDITTAYEQVYNMAQGYACYGQPLYQNEELLNDIIYALDWLKENRYNKKIRTKSGDASWKVTGFDNWWDWEIGVPIKIVHTLMLIEDKLEHGQIVEYLQYADELVPVPRMTGANYTDMAYEVMGSALLKNDIPHILNVQEMIVKTFLYVDDNERFAESLLSADRKEYTPIKGAGFFTDGSYILHTLHPQTYSYGAVQLNAFANFLSIFADTNFEMKIPFVNNVYEIFQNSFESSLFDGKVFRWTLGRSASENTGNFLKVYAYAYQLAPALDEADENGIYSVLKNVKQEHHSAIVSKLPISCIKSFKEMVAMGASDEDGKAFNKVFYNADKVVHKAIDWAVSIAMSSSRIFNYECINEQNKDGWYLSDGRTEYYIKGKDINANLAGWLALDKYRLPGTTVDTQQRKAVSISQGNEYLSSKDFVGGVTLGDYGVAAMDLESYHNESDYGLAESDGGPAPAHQNDLTAKKSYFMFDDEVVCLGTAVNASNNNNAEVLTIVENLVATKTKAISDVEGTGEPYEIVGVYANKIPEAANTPENTIDGSYTTKYAGDTGAEIWWDLGSVKTVGFIDLSFQNGNVRKQYFELAVSTDGQDGNWTVVFDGESSGTKDSNEFFDLTGIEARYVKYINKGNSTGREWVSLTNCMIYPPNADGTIGVVYPDVYGDDEIIADGVAIKPQGLGDVDVSDVFWMNTAGTCGYVFPNENTENMGKLYTRWTKGNQSCFELWFSHGENPTNGGYAYILLPGQSAEETAEYAADTNIRILANNESVQAVKDTTLGITGIVFWEAGSFNGITVDKPCMVVYRESEDGILEIAVSDPTQKLDELAVTIDQSVIDIYDVDECVNVISSATAETSVTMNCNMTGSVGRSMKAQIKVETSPVDYTNLNNAITGAEILNETEYTEESYQVMKDALDKAKTLLDDVAVAQEEVDTATQALNDAIAALVKKPDDSGSGEGSGSGDSGSGEGSGSGDSGNGEGSGSGDSGSDEPVEIVEARSDQNWTQGTLNTVTIYCTGDFADFLRIEVDGVTLDPSHYTLEEGSTILTLKADYLKTLSEGDHTVVMHYTNDRSVQMTFTVHESQENSSSGEQLEGSEQPEVSSQNQQEQVANPTTGDENIHPGWFLFIAVSAAVLMAVLIEVNRRMRKSK